MAISPERAEELRTLLAGAHTQLEHQRSSYAQLANGAARLPAGAVDDPIAAARRQLQAAAAGERYDLAQHEARQVVFEALGELVTDHSSAHVLLALCGLLDHHLLRDL